METTSVKWREGRQLVLSSVAIPGDRCVRPPFVALLPAYGPSERQQAEALSRELVKLGCIEFCCVGPQSELLHDALDEIVEADGALEIVTTWIDDPTEAIEYFLYAAGGGRPDLLALVGGHPELHAALSLRKGDRVL